MNSLVSLSLTVLAVIFFAFARKKFVFRIDSDESRMGGRTDLFLILIIILLTLFSGLRTGYNDTANYIVIFNASPKLSEFLADSSNLHPLHNPLFYFITSLIRTLTPNYHVFLMLFAAATCTLMVTFLHKMTDREDFPLSLLLFLTLGTYIFTMAAIKQSFAMALLCPAVVALRDRRYPKFFLLVAVAALVHTYAAVFFILLLFASKPWRARSFLLLAAALFIMLNFESALTSVLEYAGSIGKDIVDFEIFDGNRMNIFRVAVYSVVPVASLVFRKRLEPEMGHTQEILINMSICSVAFMLPGMVSGANMFGRIAAYFELGTVCVMPWMINTLFDKRSASLVKLLCALCFIAFALYDLSGFNEEYSKITLLTFIRELLG